MLTKDRPQTQSSQSHKAETAKPDFQNPEAWLGQTPKDDVKICFAATHVEAWEPGTQAVVSWQGKRFRIICEGKDVPLIQTARGILVGE